MHICIYGWTEVGSAPGPNGIYNPASITRIGGWPLQTSWSGQPCDGRYTSAAQSDDHERGAAQAAHDRSLPQPCDTPCARKWHRAPCPRPALAWGAAASAQHCRPCVVV